MFVRHFAEFPRLRNVNYDRGAFLMRAPSPRGHLMLLICCVYKIRTDGSIVIFVL